MTTAADRPAPGAPESTTPPEPVVATDPASIRALAHPLRLRLLALLDDEGEVTATRCAGVTGESGASGALHHPRRAHYREGGAAARRGKARP
ncbi:MAG: hypothetical protein ACTMID_02715, partial [Cellulosimicrobium funkei]